MALCDSKGSRHTRESPPLHDSKKSFSSTVNIFYVHTNDTKIYDNNITFLQSRQYIGQLENDQQTEECQAVLKRCVLQGYG